MKIQDLVLRLNQKAKADFAIQYREHNPILSSLGYILPAAGKESIKHIFAQFLIGYRKFTGNRIYENPPENWELLVLNQIGDKGIEIDVDELQEIANKGSSFDVDKALEVWINPLAWLGKAARDYPFTQIIQIIENGTSTTPLTGLGIGDTVTALDGQPLFSASHAYDESSGSLSNIQTGTGVASITTIEADFINLIGKLQKMEYGPTGGVTGEKRLLNQGIMSVRVHCPAVLKPLFDKLKKSFSVSTITGDNVVATSIIKDVVPHPFTDQVDWYVEVLDAETPFMRPFVIQDVYSARLDTASMNDYSVKNNNKLQYGGRLKVGLGIAAFWKMGKVNNT